MIMAGFMFVGSSPRSISWLSPTQSSSRKAKWDNLSPCVAIVTNGNYPSGSCQRHRAQITETVEPQRDS